MWTDNQKRVYAKSCEKRLREMQENTYDRAHGTPTGYKYGCRCFHCRLAESERQARYYARNKAKVRKRNRAYYKEHRDRYLERSREAYRALKAAAWNGGK